MPLRDLPPRTLIFAESPEHDPGGTSPRSSYCRRCKRTLTVGQHTGNQQRLHPTSRALAEACGVSHETIGRTRCAGNHEKRAVPGPIPSRDGHGVSAQYGTPPSTIRISTRIDCRLQCQKVCASHSPVGPYQASEVEAMASQVGQGTFLQGGGAWQVPGRIARSLDHDRGEASRCLGLLPAVGGGLSADPAPVCRRLL